jgi:Reverse transcriptase (RNA-dependent DNA polymerase)
VIVASLNVNKAFDRVDHSVLFINLRRRGLPESVEQLLDSWCRPCACKYVILLCNAAAFMSELWHSTGVVLSSVLFSMYLDDLVSCTPSAGLGCFMGCSYLGSISYADNLALIISTIVSVN